LRGDRELEARLQILVLVGDLDQFADPQPDADRTADAGEHLADLGGFVAQAGEISLYGLEGPSRLVDGADEDLGSLGCH
jgi:hypothetical protein